MSERNFVEDDEEELMKEFGSKFECVGGYSFDSKDAYDLSGKKLVIARYPDGRAKSCFGRAIFPYVDVPDDKIPSGLYKTKETRKTMCGRIVPVYRSTVNDLESRHTSDGSDMWYGVPPKKSKRAKKVRKRAKKGENR
jgi:hypothetical protein